MNRHQIFIAMQKILVPVDFSEDTHHALKMACFLAEKHKCGIFLLHSYFDIIFAQTINTVTPDEFIPVIEPDVSFLKESLEKEMKILSDKIHKEYPPLLIETEVTGLDLNEAIEAVRSRNDILLIVIGAAGTGKKESFSGSTASSLFDSAPVPVLAIPKNNKNEAYIKRNILYATNFAEAAADEVRFILNYFIEDTNRLLCRHLRFPDNDSLLDDAQMEVLRKPFAKEVKAGKVSFEIIDTGNAEETLHTIVEQENIGFISFHGSNRNFFQRLFHKAIAKKDIYKFNMPLLVFRKYEAGNEESK